MVLIPDLRTIKAEYVISNGVIIAQEGRLLVEPRPAVFGGGELKKIHVTPNDFSIKGAEERFFEGQGDGSGHGTGDQGSPPGSPGA